MNIIRHIKNIFLPNTCLACESVVESYGLCNTCIRLLRMSRCPACKFCGTPLLYSLEDQPCQKCANKTNYISKLYSVFEYNNIIKNIIIKFKNCADFRLQKWMTNMMSILINDIDVDYVIPVPMHLIRQINRGYNQSAILAIDVASHLGCSCRLDILYKNCSRRQANLDKQERIRNLLGTFYISENTNIIGKKILIVDDVKTTGATLEECAKVLLSGGAVSVQAVVFAITYV